MTLAPADGPCPEPGPPCAHASPRTETPHDHGLNNKIRVIQRRAYGLHDEDYLRLKVLTCMPPAL
jgi:hypothetical protein